VLELFTELGQSKEIPPALLNIGNVYQGQGNHQQALEYYQKALEGFKNAKANVGIAYATSNIGSVYLNSGEYDKALTFLLQAKDLKKAFLPNDHESFFNLGLVYAYQDKHPEALENFQKSLEIAERIKNQNSVAETLEAMADEYFSQGNYQKSLELSGKAISLATEFDYPQIYWKALLLSAKSHLVLGQGSDAKQELMLAVSIIENLRGNVAGNEEDQQRSFADKTSPYSLLVELLISQNNFTEALNYAERSKSRVLLDVLKSGKVNISKAMTAQEIIEEEKFSDEIVSLNSQVRKEGQNPKANQNLLMSLNERIDKKRLEFEDFQTRLYARHPELKVLRGETRTVTPEEIGKLLPDLNSAVLEFVVKDGKTFLFVITKNQGRETVSINAYPIDIKQRDLAKLTNNFRSKAARGDLDFKLEARQLYNLLLKPAEQRIRNKTNLVIVPDNVLWDLPFQALQSAENKYLIETAAISYAPSMTVWREMVRKSRSRQFSGKTLLAFGNPHVGNETSAEKKEILMGEELKPLPEAERLVNSLKEIYGSSQSKIFIGKEAKEETVKAESSKYRILQFAAHSILNDVNPMYSHIVLSQSNDGGEEDGLLEAWEMKDLNLNADLVILSACETARGSFGSGEGIIGMTWSMFIAGAPTTVASQWKVESSSTTELMLEFHRQLLKGKNVSKAEALRRASLHLLKDPKYKHPSYWAGFVLIGDGN
jgi:CHAT domain-containing protein